MEPLSQAQETEFQDFLARRRLVPETKLKFYLHWVRNFLARSSSGKQTQLPKEIQGYLDNLGREKEPWQVQQAREAIRLYLYFLDASRPAMEAERSAEVEWRVGRMGKPWRVADSECSG